MAERILQRAVMPPKRRLRRLYYRCQRASEVRQQGRCALELSRNATVRFDTFFNAFYENYWRKYTALRHLALRLRVRGSGVVRIYRRTRERASLLICERDFSVRHGESTLEMDVPPGEGFLYFEIVSHGQSTRLSKAEWFARAVEPRPVRFVAALCTFNRAGLLLANLNRLFADERALKWLQRVVVVDQGEEKVRDHPRHARLASLAGSRLRWIEQTNRGGAGGFTRGLLEARKESAATHVLFMDDDIVLETESIVRAAAFFSLARDDFALGGHMLDRSEPRVLVECGSRYRPDRIRIDEPRKRRVDRPDGLRPFLELEPRHYNGWWFHAFSLPALERAGLPLPLFLRGDDVEYGCRLLRNGIATVALPGIAVWHESFDGKGRSWHPFYELRNLLIVGVLHFPDTAARTVSRHFFSRLLDELLTFDYGEATLMCEAAAAYLRGPTALVEEGTALHRRIAALARSFSPPTCPRDAVGPSCVPRPSNRCRATRWGRWRLVLRNLVRSSPPPDASPQRTLRGGEQWYDVEDADVVAVDESHRPDCLVIRRSRGRFVRCLIRGAWLALRLFLSHGRVAHAWRSGGKPLTRPAFWTRHLNVLDSQSVGEEAAHFAPSQTETNLVP